MFWIFKLSFVVDILALFLTWRPFGQLLKNWAIFFKSSGHPVPGQAFWNATTLSIMTVSFKTFSIMDLISTLGINGSTISLMSVALQCCRSFSPSICTMHKVKIKNKVNDAKYGFCFTNISAENLWHILGYSLCDKNDNKYH